MRKFKAFERLTAESRKPYRVKVVQIRLAIGSKGVGCAGRVGESHPRVKHSDDVVATARALFANGVGVPGIARQLGINCTTIWHWVHNRRRLPRDCRIVSIRRKVPVDAE